MEDEDEEAAGSVFELPVLETKSGSQELDQAVVIRQEEFVAVEKDAERIKDELKDKKVAEHFFLQYTKCMLQKRFLCQVLQGNNVSTQILSDYMSLNFF